LNKKANLYQAESGVGWHAGHQVKTPDKTGVNAYGISSISAAPDKFRLVIERVRWMGWPAIRPAPFAISAGPSIAPIAAAIPAAEIVHARDLLDILVFLQVRVQPVVRYLVPHAAPIVVSDGNIRPCIEETFGDMESPFVKEIATHVIDLGRAILNQRLPDISLFQHVGPRIGGIVDNADVLAIIAGRSLAGVVLHPVEGPRTVVACLSSTASSQGHRWCSQQGQDHQHEY
jgi:hypothetical protein